MLRIQFFIILFTPTFLPFESWGKDAAYCSQLFSEIVVHREIGDQSYPDEIHTLVGGGPEITFIQTNRSLEDLSGKGKTPMPFTYPERLLNVAKLRGLKVLDAPTGKGQFVKDLRRLGIEAYGIDISFTEELKQTEQGVFNEGSIYKLPYRTESFDVVYCNFFFMGLEGRPDLIKRSLFQLKKVIHKKGKIRILRIINNINLFKQIVQEVGLKITDAPSAGEPQRYFLELQINNDE